MTAEEVLELALGIPESERAALLHRACDGDNDLRRRVEEMLAAHFRAESSVEPAAADTFSTRKDTSRPEERIRTVDFTPRLFAGAVIAERYTLVERIGEGGMGEVWVARQSEPVKRKVALKLIKAGMDSREVMARFEHERQALAVMDHPNIAKVLDGGLTADRHPFFVMELVHGRPVTKVCDEARLPVEERLRLFVAICQAVQHAHQKGIIHRDIKPANILVTEVDGKLVPKVIDFGVAKAVIGKLTDESLSTQFGAVVGTLEYMAPEQAGLTAQDIDTRADVYSLGILLYELLAGMRPFDSQRLRQAPLEEKIRIIKEEDPPSLVSRLSTDGTLADVAALRQMEPRRLLALVRGELDWIVMKCLEKDRNRRYESAIELARDIERYLADEPVEARPASAGYRLRKFYRRNRGAVIAASLVLLAIVGGIVGTTLGLINAENQRQIAERNEREAARAGKEAEDRATSEAAAKKQAQVETKRAENEKKRADDKAEEVRHALYAARQQVAMNAWRENQADLLAECVERQKPGPGELDLRDLEWTYLDRLARAPGRRWQQKGQMVNGVAISPDNGTAITVGFDGKATAWDAATGRKLWDTGNTFRWSVNAAVFSPDGKTIALAGHLGQLQLWNSDGTQRAKLDGHRAQVFGVAFSPDGKTLSSASADVSVRLWDVATGKAASVLSVGPEPEGGGPGPRVTPQTDPAQSVGHTNMVWQTAWAPDGKRLASCSTDGSIKIWALPEGKLLRTMTGHEGIVVAAAWCPDGRLIASVSRPMVGMGGEVKLWNPDTGRTEATFRPPTGGLHAVAFTPDGLFVVTGGQDRTVRVWRKDGRLVAEHRGFRDEVIGLAVGGDGRWAIAGTRGGEIIALELDTAPGKRSTATSVATQLAVAADGRLAAFHGGPVQWHDAETLASIVTWPAAKLPPSEEKRSVLSDAAAFAMRPDGEMAHSAHHYVGSGTLVWRDAGGKVRHLLSGHTAPIAAAAFLPDDQLASVDETGEVRIWNGATGQATTTLKPWDGPVRFLAATRDGRLWIGGATWAPGSESSRTRRPTSQEGKLARIEDGRIVWEGPTPSALSAADVSPDRKLLVVASADSALAWLDADTGKELRRRASAAMGPAVSVRFSPNGRRIAVGGANNTVRLIDTVSGEDLLALEGLASPATSLAFLADGKRLAASTYYPTTGGMIVVWDGRQAGEPPPLPAPDVAWHKTRLDVASDNDRRILGPRMKDDFAMRYHLNRLAALEPDELKWPRSLVALDQDASDYRTAAKRLDVIVRRWPDDAPMWYDLGNAKRELDDVPGAEAAFRKCIAVDSKMAEAYCNLGLLLHRDGRFAEAADFLKQGHELGTTQQKPEKRWMYPSAAWLARSSRLADVATRHGARKDFADVPEGDRADLVEVLMLTKRPLAAVRLADAKPEKSPGPVVVGAALRCAEGIGDAGSLSAAERTTWRNKALAWLRLDYESFGTSAAPQRARMCAGMRAHPFLQISRGDRVASWPEMGRDAWKKFWAEVDATAAER